MCYIFWECVCSLSYPACKADAPYCHLWPARLYSIFCTLSHKRHDFRTNTLLEITCVFWSYLQILPQTFLILRRTERDMTKNVYLPWCKVPVILVKFNETWNFATYFPKILKDQVSLKMSTGSRVVPCGRTDRTKPNSRSSQFCEQA